MMRQLRKWRIIMRRYPVGGAEVFGYCGCLVVLGVGFVMIGVTH